MRSALQLVANSRSQVACRATACSTMADQLVLTAGGISAAAPDDISSSSVPEQPAAHSHCVISSDDEQQRPVCRQTCRSLGLDVRLQPAPSTTRPGHWTHRSGPCRAHSLQAIQRQSLQWQAARAFATFKLPLQQNRKQQQQKDQQVRLVFEDGKHEVMLRSAAQSLASKQGMDLIMVADKAQPPVMKLGEVDSLQRAQRRAEKEQRKREAEQRRRMSVKEVRIGALTAEHDLGLKLKQARGFLEKGFRVKLVVRFGHWQRQNGEARLRSVTAECKQWSHVTAPQANEKMARNTFQIYLTPGFGMTGPEQPPQPPQASAARQPAAAPPQAAFG